MRSFPIVAALLSQVALSVAEPSLQDLYEEVAPLLRRQAPGSASYQCHYDCGFTISGGRVAGYCDSEDWKNLYNACLECANTFDLWGSYGNGVTKAASGCDLTPTPSASLAEVPTALPTLPTYTGGASAATTQGGSAAGNSTASTTSAPTDAAATTTSSGTSTSTTVAPNGAQKTTFAGAALLLGIAAYII